MPRRLLLLLLAALPLQAYDVVYTKKKEKLEGTHGDGSGVREYIIPLDLLRMTVSPTLLTDIEEVKVAYKKGG